jgi:hypothetical protein
MWLSGKNAHYIFTRSAIHLLRHGSKRGPSALQSVAWRIAHAAVSCDLWRATCDVNTVKQL